ncbi:hypothetical protein [Mesorhizobium sp. CC13]|uniref:hypothetical protein n=1 Tax=Phyllobacteriaceae TaxID=69277 RepID=UPI0032664D85
MLSSSNQTLVAFTKELVPGIRDLTPPMGDHFGQFAQGARAEAVIVRYHDIRPAHRPENRFRFSESTMRRFKT